MDGILGAAFVGSCIGGVIGLIRWFSSSEENRTPANLNKLKWGIALIALLGISYWYIENNYSPVYDHNFMTSCEATSGGNTAGCSCLLNGIKQDYTFQEAKQFDSYAITTGSVPPELESLASSCQ